MSGEKNRKKPSGNAGDKPGPLVPQEHGGAIFQGAAPAESRVAGTGRPRSELRRRMRGTLDERYKVVEDALQDDSGTSFADKMRALEWLARFGLGEQANYDPELVAELWASVEPLLEDEEKERVRAQWVTVLGEYMRR